MPTKKKHREREISFVTIERPYDRFSLHLCFTPPATLSSVSLLYPGLLVREMTAGEKETYQEARRRQTRINALGYR